MQETGYNNTSTRCPACFPPKEKKLRKKSHKQDLMSTPSARQGRTIAGGGYSKSTKTRGIRTAKKVNENRMKKSEGFQQVATV